MRLHESENSGKDCKWRVLAKLVWCRCCSAAWAVHLKAPHCFNSAFLQYENEKLSTELDDVRADLDLLLSSTVNGAVVRGALLSGGALPGSADAAAGSVMSSALHAAMQEQLKAARERRAEERRLVAVAEEAARNVRAMFAKATSGQVASVSKSSSGDATHAADATVTDSQANITSPSPRSGSKSGEKLPAFPDAPSPAAAAAAAAASASASGSISGPLDSAASAAAAQRSVPASRGLIL